jgi:glycosyltransferase involved in cell wall biosynthesis
VLLVSNRPLTIGSETFRAGFPFTVEDWRGKLLIEAGTARHARPPDVLYEKRSREQNDACLREQGATCLCLTRNRREWLPKAIESYLAQSFPFRELLIIADGEEVRHLLPEREDIRLIHIEEGRTIGSKRNFGVQQSFGKYVVHWDDDDISAPDRIHSQLHQITSAGCAVTGYHEFELTDGAAWWRYSGDRGYAPGSSLFYERSWAIAHPFPELQVGEDGEFCKIARDFNQIVTNTASGMLTASIHPGNTSPRPLSREIYTKLERSAFGLTVIIPSKTLSNAVRCVDAVRRLEPEARIVIVDDGVEDVHSLGVDVITGEKPFIFARNVNAGIRFAGRDDVVVLNDDAILETERGFSSLLQALKDHPEMGIVAATTNAVGNRNQLRHGIGLREDPRMVCFVAVLIPRATLDKVGYLDERFVKYGFEDDDLCYRVRRAGLKIGIFDGCFVDHASLRSTFRGEATNPADLAGGKRIFVDKWGSYPL